MDSQNLVTLLRFDHNEQIAVARSILDNAGIESFVRNEYMASILPIEDIDAELMVREEDATRAMQLLESFIKGE
ncbi:MAG: DUF2007 domain-containing protein [Rikenellaceae bacterium]|nr:DUF2007 domain-containing protein [Rikenellaceae bacterium]MBQ5894495.1 DUF2007 domain-containing protein [Rikenellaceae bacterium]